MGDSSEKAGAGGGVRIAWVKLGKVWWPGQRLSEDELTEQMKSELEALLSKKKSLKPEGVHVVKFFNEDEYEIAHNPALVLVDIDEDKKFDLVKRAVSSMKSSTLAENKLKFKADVLQAERLLNPSADLTDLTKILDGETLEKKPAGASKYADIFPSAKPEKPSPGISPLAGKGKAGAIKFNFPSSRIINKASSKPPSKISPLPSDPSKKYTCAKCSFSVDRVNVITAHMKYCNGTPSPQKRATPTKATTPSAQPKKATSTPSTPKKMTSTPSTSTPPVPVPSPKKADPATTPATPTTSTTPVKRRPGRPPRKSVAPPATPDATASSPPKISPAVEPAAAPVPKKRGRRSKKDKQLSEQQKAEILQDWNDSSSEENDSDDELAPMLPPTKPPELFLFGSEKNKKRKADAVEEKVDAVASDGEVKATGVANEDEPPVLKKPRTDKELSDAFDSLLKTTKMELPEWDGKKETDDEMEVDEHQLSDIEEDANIVMKKGDAVEDEEVVNDAVKTADADDMEVVKDEPSSPEKKSPGKRGKSVASKAKTPEPAKPVEAPTPPTTPTTTTKKAEADKKKETSSKKAEEKKVEVTPTRKSARTRGGAIIKEPDTKQIEEEKQSAKAVVTPSPTTSPKKKTEEVPVKRESPKKVLPTSAKEDDKKVEPVSILDTEETKKEATESEKSKPPRRASSPRKKEVKEDKVEEVSKLEPKKVEAVPEPKQLAPIVPVSTEAPPPPVVVEDTKETIKEPTKKEEKKVGKKDDKKEEKKGVKKDELKEDKETVKKTEEKKEEKKQVEKDEIKEEIKEVKTDDKKAESEVPPPEPVQDVKKTEGKKSAPPSPTKAVTQPVPAPVPTTVATASVTPSSPTKAKATTVATVKATAASPPVPKAASGTVTTSAPVAKPIVETSAPVHIPPLPIVNATKSAPPPKPVPQKKVEEKKPVVTAAPVVSAVKVPTPTASPTKVAVQPPQKKPTAAVRPLVDTKEVPPATVKDGKGAPATVTVTTPPKGSPKDQAQATAGQIPVTQQQQQQQGDGDESGKKSPALVAQRVVHLVPVENQDGTITYMLLSLENGDNPNVVLEQGGETSNTVLRVDKVEPSDQAAPMPLPMNPNEVEGIFLDKNVENANQIVSALAQATQSMTQTTATATSVMDGTTAYVTLAMDAMDGGLGIAASGSEAVATSGVGVVQPSILVQEGTADGQDGSGESQQVFYMTEDGSILDPSSIGLTFEQLQQLLNQSS